MPTAQQISFPQDLRTVNAAPEHFQAGREALLAPTFLRDELESRTLRPSLCAIMAYRLCRIPQGGH
jgi:hypothetical protein